MHVIGHLQQAVRYRPHTADLAAALIILFVTLLTTTVPNHLRDGVALLAAVVACGALLARRRWPFAVLTISTVAAEVYLGRYHGRNGTLILAAPLFALYTVAARSDRRRALLVGGVVVLAVGTFHTFGVPSRWLGPENLALAAFGGLAVAAGTAVRHHRAYLAEVERRARDAERVRETETRRRLTEERLRIARDLHDSVGHHLALINVQAGVAGHTSAGADPGLRGDAARWSPADRWIPCRRGAAGDLVTGAGPIRVVVADDQPLIRASFTTLVESAADLRVVGRAGSGEEVIDVVRGTGADVVLMDIRMPGLDGLTATRLGCLTDRERQILGLVAAGLGNDDIAAHLTLSPHTVKTHVNRTMMKLHAHDRAQLVIAAYETGLVRPGHPPIEGGRSPLQPPARRSAEQG